VRSVQLFVAAYEERSFTLAAEREGATQSGVSQHVRQLETRHGVLLFRREKGRVIPTPAADTFYQHCLQALRAHETAFQRLRQFSHGLRGEARLGLMPTMNAAALAPALMEFRQSHPNVKVSVTEAYSAALVEMVISGDLDVAVVPAMSAVLGIRVTPFVAVPEVFVRARGTHSDTAPLRPATLGPLKLVLPEIANIRAQTIRSYLASQNAEIAEVIEMNSMMGTLDLIARSDWCAILPALLMATRTYGDTFDIRPLDPPLELQLVTVESASTALSPSADVFCEMLRASCLALLTPAHSPK
jgi:LysR family transcriptional regulator, nitrogen assimilation regulatory protein